jgi:hypothetical protein
MSIPASVSVSSTIRYHGVVSSKGMATCGTVAAIASIWLRDMIFEAAEPVADGAAQALHDLDALQFEQRQGRAARRRKQLQHRRGDDAKRSFRANEELLRGHALR